MWQSWIGWKIRLCKWQAFWMAPCLIFYFIVILYKWLFMRNLATIFPLKSTLSGKFQRFNAIDGSIAMLKNGWISNIVRHFTRPKQQAALKKLFSLPQPPPHHHHHHHHHLHQITFYYVSGTKIFLRRNI